MSTLYYVNPANTADITRLGVAPVGRTTLPDGRTVERLDGPVPEWDVYGSQEDTTPLPAYNTRERIDTAFVGVVKDPAAFVQETNVYQQIPIADLYDIKSQEVRDKDDDVRYNAVDTSLSANWWVVITEKAQGELLWVAVGSNSRQLNGQQWPVGQNIPVVAVYNATNQKIRREPVSNQATWDTIEQEIAQHLQQTSNATKASGDSLDAKYDNGAGDWQAVADHDPADPAWGYPPTVNGEMMRLAMRDI